MVPSEAGDFQFANNSVKYFRRISRFYTYEKTLYKFVDFYWKDKWENFLKIDIWKKLISRNKFLEKYIWKERGIQKIFEKIYIIISRHLNIFKKVYLKNIYT